MTTLDQRILIPVPQVAVWAYLSDISRNPQWIADCREVSFLSTKREGAGTRWRYLTPGGREYIVEVAAWYKGLGYEYIFVNGVNYESNRGRIRLQEIAEGTIVQWTFTFEERGFLTGLRGASRKLENLMADSLRNLFKEVVQTSKEARLAPPQSLMRDAPDVEARMQYKARAGGEDSASPEAPTPSTPAETAFDPFSANFSFEDEPAISFEDGQKIEPIQLGDEPPTTEFDTRPVVASTPTQEGQNEPVVDTDTEEPEFLASITEDDYARFGNPAKATAEHAVLTTDTSQAEAKMISEGGPVMDEPPSEPPPPRDPVVSALKSEMVSEGGPVEIPQYVEVPPIETVVHSVDPFGNTTETSTQTYDFGEVETTTSERVPTEAHTPTESVDGEKSIWEIFGVERPRFDAPVSAEPARTPDQEVTSVASQPTETEAHTPTPPHRRVGLRVRLRSNHVRVQWPIMKK